MSAAGGPWGLIATYFNALGGNVSASDEARKKGEKQPQQAGYEYGSAPELDRSNFEAGSPSTVGSNLIGDYGKTFGGPLFKGAIEGEADMYSPNMQAQGAVAKAPLEVNSKQSPFISSLLDSYRNYMKYQRGY